MRRIGLLLVVVVGLVTAPLRAADPDLVGVYKCDGVNPEGTAYTATVEIARQGEVFHLRWVFPGGEENRGIGLNIGGKLSVAVFGIVGASLRTFPVATALVVFSVGKASPLTLDGRWTYVHPTARTIHDETLTKLPKGHPRPSAEPTPQKKPPAGQITA